MVIKHKTLLIFIPIIILLVIAFLISLFLFDDNKSIQNENGYTLRLEPDNIFQADLRITNDKSLFYRWGNGSPGIEFRTINSAKKNEEFFAVIFFGKTGVDKNNNAIITYNITITSPSGDVYFENKEVDCWINLPAPRGDEIQMCEQNFNIAIEDEDDFGEYTIDVIIFDRIKDESVYLSNNIIID